MSLLGNIEPFLPGGNFKSYEDRVKQFFVINEVENNKKTPLFITIAGPDIYEVLKSLTHPELPSKKSFDEIIILLTEHYTPKINKRAERFKFHKAKQEVGESINEFIVRLKQLIQTCRFSDFLDGENTERIPVYKSKILDENLTDRFIIGLSNDKIQQSLLNDESLSFDKCCEKALNMEMVERESRALNPFSQNAVYNRSSNNNNNSQSRFRQNNTSSQKSNSTFQNQSNTRPSQSNIPKKYPACKRCARHHNEETCPAWEWECFTCGKLGHTSRVCKQKSNERIRSQVNKMEMDSTESNESQDTINTVNTVTVIGAIQHYPLKFEIEVETTQMKFEIDTGACVTIMSKFEYFELFENIPYVRTEKSLSSISGHKLVEFGTITVNVKFGIKKEKLEIVIINSDNHFCALMGRNWLDILMPHWRNALVNEDDTYFLNSVSTMSCLLTEIKSKFPKVVKVGLDTPIEGFSADLVLRENTVPIFHAPYGVPFKLKEKVEVELDRLVSEKILTPVKFSRWATPAVIVPKPNGDIRICLDCKVTINKYLETEHYPLPKISDIFSSLANCKVFCVIDLTGAYQQLAMSPDSKELLTINTHKGLFTYSRLAFGVSSAPAIFQSVMDQILKSISGVFCYLDDILIGAEDESKCKSKLFEVLSRLEQHNVRINLNKCKFLEKRVKYLGHTLSNGCIHPNSDKVSAILQAPVPKNVSTLQSYLGLLNYYSHFLPDLSTVLYELYRLLRKDISFEWTAKCQEVFNKSKRLLIDNQVLTLYDPDKPIIIAADASPYGVGAVLSHIVDGVERPVFFASSTLSPAERNYSQTHREALAIIFAVKKFHNYLYGQKFTILTDHQSLREIFNPKKGTPSVAVARLQRWAIIMSMYSYQIIYKSGSKMANADALSRLPLGDETEVESIQINFFNFTEELPVSFEEICRSYSNDVVLSKVYKFVLSGWPQNVPDQFQSYYRKRQSITTDSNCLYYLNRLIVPQECRAKILKSFHQNHTGIVRMKMVARSYVWWPGLDTDIENWVGQCLSCQQTQVVSKSKEITSWKKTYFPFERIHIDFFKFAGKDFMILSDAHSKYIDVQLMTNTNVHSVIEKLKIFFCIFGLPSEIVSDNGPPFQSYGFKNFCDSHGITCTHSPPYHPSSNGQAERSVRTTKNCLYRFCVEKGRSLPLKEKVLRFMFHHNHTPTTTTKRSPAEIIFAFKPKTILDLMNNKNKTSAHKTSDDNKSVYTNKINIDREKSKLINSNVNGQDLTSYTKYMVGQNVMYLNHFKHHIRWMPAKVLKVLSPLTYLIVVNNNVRFVHLNQIRLSKLPEHFHKNCGGNIRCPSPSTKNEESFYESCDSDTNELGYTVTQKRKREETSSSSSSSPEKNSVEDGLRRSTRQRRIPKRFSHSQYR